MVAQSCTEVRVTLIVVRRYSLMKAPPGVNDYEYFMNVTKLTDLVTPALENLYLVGYPIVTAVRLRLLTADYVQLDRLDANAQFDHPDWLW